MAYIEMENPKRRGRKRNKRRNPSTATKAATAKRANPVKRRSITSSQVAAYAKANGLSVTKKTANPKRRKSRKHRNGLTAIPRRSNGILGNTKKDVKEVIALLVGLFGAKGLGRFIIPYAQPYMAQMGAGKYTEIIIDAVIGLGGLPYLAKKFGAGNLSSLVRLGGAASVGIDAIELIAPDTFNALNPFNSNPIVITSGGQAAIPVSTVAQAAAEIAASPNANTKAAQLAGALGANMPIIDNDSMTMPLGGVY